MFASMKKANIDELKVSEARPGVTRRSFSGEGATLAWGELTPGHEPRPGVRSSRTRWPNGKFQLPGS